MSEFGEVVEVLRLDDLALHDGNGVEPAGAHGQVHDLRDAPGLLYSFDGAVPLWEKALSTTQNTLRAEA